jgi:metal-responsive CopG/Arc/MetJ family transcriptional regulator
MVSAVHIPGVPKQPAPAKRTKADPKRMSITLTGDAYDALQRLSERQGGIKLNEVIRRAIATEDYIREELSSNSQILVQKSDGTIRQVVFR